VVRKYSSRLFVSDTVQQFDGGHLEFSGSGNVNLIGLKSSPPGDQSVWLDGWIGGIFVIRVGIEVLGVRGAEELNQLDRLVTVGGMSSYAGA
jgi:hypothetical protein